MRGIILLLASVFLLMFGYNAVEAAYPLHSYKQATVVLSALYLSLTLSNIAAGFLVSRWQAGSLIIFGPSGYLLFTLCLMTDDFLLSMVSSVVLGFTAALYWICARTIIFKGVDERRWGLAFGLLGTAAVLAGGLGPYLLLKLPYEKLLAISFAICLLSLFPLIPLRGRWRGEKQPFAIPLSKGFVLYTAASFCFSVSLPILIAFIPLLAGSGEVVGEYRLVSYAIPSTLSPIGGFLYDKLGAIVIPAFSLLALVAFLNLSTNLIAWGVVLTLSFSMLFPGFQALLGKIVAEDQVAMALGFVGLVSGVGVSVNIALIGILSSNLAMLNQYLAFLILLGMVLSSCLLRSTGLKDHSV